MSVVGFKYYETDKTFQPEKDTWACRTFFSKAKIHLIRVTKWQQCRIWVYYACVWVQQKVQQCCLLFLDRKWSRLFVIGQLGLKLFIFKQNHPISSGSIKQQWMTGPKLIHQIKRSLFLVEITNYSLPYHQPEAFQKILAQALRIKQSLLGLVLLL